MLEGLRQLFSFSDRSFWEVVRDFADIIIVAYIFYRALLVLRGTRAMQMGVGFVIFGLLYLLAKHAELATLLNVLSWLASSLILIVVVVFQNDIRRALIRMGARAWLSRGREQRTRVVDEVVGAVTDLARHRMGAIVAFERDANLMEFVRSEGIPMDSLVSRELLVSLFIPEAANKTHDGAVIIRDLRIVRAGVFFPMPDLKSVDPSYGSRHRAAIGIAEETDAVVVVVSEERGTITLCFKGGHVPNVDGANLRNTLLDQLGHRDKKKEKRLIQRMGFGWRRAEKSAAEPETKRAAAAAPVTVKSTAAKKAGATAAAAASSKTATAPKAASTGPRSVRGVSVSAGAGKSSTDSSTPMPSTALARLTDRTETRTLSSTPPPSRVSVPMPSAKDRKSPSETAPGRSDQERPEEEQADSRPPASTRMPRTGSAARSVSRPMSSGAKSKGSSASSGGDEP